MNKILPVIMSGGIGSRLWPLSREQYPKQFLALNDEAGKTMLQTTILRLNALSCLHSFPLVICNEEHRFLVAEQLRKINKLNKNIILEPEGRNTAPTIALAALATLQEKNDPLLLILPADHVIHDKNSFYTSIKMAIPHAVAGKLVTFGIVPTSAETGYGYIKRGNLLTHDLSSEIFLVDKFVEKPCLIQAEHYIKSGTYYWNSGMFLFRASRYLEELKKLSPDIYDSCSNSVENIFQDLDFTRVDKTAFLSCPSNSIDYAVMENTDDAVVVPMSAGWNDVGSWSSLWDISVKDDFGNVIHGDIISYESYDNYLHSDSALLATIGVRDLTIIQTEDAILVAHKNKTQDVKYIVEKLKKDGRPEYKKHQCSYHTWGTAKLIDYSPYHRVNKLTIKPNGQLSLQSHYHRSEHWVILSGTAEVIRGSELLRLTKNQSIYIPAGEAHSLKNSGQVNLEVIEIQSGDYISDIDIIRLL
ncbi:mannose-1-phosphate guanylyltransferase/mannose-6-phosphate isomerase [Xenorhabdus lircayensis]|uniref:mannose-1-phosphate guanylyltransferase n=1 Tax=Xenorhabdus lircayensis TaxID=2763499 RepID=A0ABS0U2B3_9GAMM|nr:mannose-1-phosphate guanylyltransferase/mannose-6-phosphate isomerase [Xenorhabdus lircayensis]MBI6548026.1 mannose-1-phosphate guanylyltransferase/mannose-6-phosphate isomerase [Xenorhabdus lircayensis]